MQDLAAYISTQNIYILIGSILLTALSYTLLSGFDLLSLRYIESDLPYKKVAFQSLISYALSHSLGFTTFTGGATRFRFLSKWGLSPLQIAQALAFSGLIFWLGFFTSNGIFLILYNDFLKWDLKLGFRVHTLPIGLLFLIICSSAIYFIHRKHEFQIKDWVFPAPKISLILLGLILAVLDWIVAGYVFKILVPSSQTPFLEFIINFQLAHLLGLISHVPGGIGIFEWVMLTTLNSNKSEVVAALVVYRLIYYLIPLLISVLLLALYEIRDHKFLKLRTSGNAISNFFTGTVFLSGVILLVSGATPALHSRMRFLSKIAPLSAIEFSHFFGSIIGVLLIIIARGLYRKLQAAYIISLFLLLSGSILSLVKGFDYEESFILLVVFLLLLPNGDFFYRRKGSLFVTQFTNLFLVIVGIIWLTFFSFKHLEYSNTLWWEFSLFSDAPRSLRAMVGLSVTSVIVGILGLLKSHPSPFRLPSEADLSHAKIIVDNSTESMAALALLGDKYLLFSEERDAFLMFNIEGSSWISMGDPMGNQNNFSELIWRFRELCDAQGGLCVFYQVSTKNIPLYIETGLEILKLGEEAVVYTEDFSLEGKSKSSLRHTKNKLTKEGWNVEFLPSTDVAQLIPELKKVSDEWLIEKKTKEKGFSLGNFNINYLKHFPLVVVRKDNQIIAFSNLWEGNGKTELSIDLMRHSHSAPNGIMDLMFIELLLYAKRQGYQKFNLGMAPLSGFEEHRLTSLWNKIGRIIYDKGEKYYNFQGLRNYKSKFNPEWESRYMAAPPGLKLATAVSNVATLISGGVRGLVSK